MIIRYGELNPSNASGWVTFNQFFALMLNGGLRSVEYPSINYYVSSAADCIYMETFPIDADCNVMAPDTPKVKFRHSIGNIKDVLKDSPFSESFAGETYVHYFLNTFSYHRCHAPLNREIT